GGAEALLFQSVPDLDHVRIFADTPPGVVDVVIRAVGEMVPNAANRAVLAGNDEYGAGRRLAPPACLIPIEGDPADVTEIVTAYADWLVTSNVPKLFLKAEPGGILAGGVVLNLARRLPAQTEVMVRGIHFVQEDSPDEIGRAVAGWMGTLG